MDRQLFLSRQEWTIFVSLDYPCDVFIFNSILKIIMHMRQKLD